MQLRDVNYYSDVLISIDIYAQSHSKGHWRGEGVKVQNYVFYVLKGHWDGGRDRNKCILINHCINKGGPSQVGGSYSWWGHTTGL